MQAERLALASTEGKIQLALRNPLDKGAPETPGIKPGDAARHRQGRRPRRLARRRRQEAAARSRSRPTAPALPTVEIIRGDKRAAEVIALGGAQRTPMEPARGAGAEIAGARRLHHRDPRRDAAGAAAARRSAARPARSRPVRRRCATTRPTSTCWSDARRILNVGAADHARLADRCPTSPTRWSPRRSSC